MSEKELSLRKLRYLASLKFQLCQFSFSTATAPAEAAEDTGILMSGEAIWTINAAHHTKRLVERVGVGVRFAFILKARHVSSDA